MTVRAMLLMFTGALVTTILDIIMNTSSIGSDLASLAIFGVTLVGMTMMIEKDKEEKS